MEVFVSEHGSAILSGIVSICVIFVLMMVIEVLGDMSLVSMDQILGSVSPFGIGQLLG